MKVVVLDASDDDGDKAVVAEAISEFAVECNAGGIGGNGLYFSDGVTAGSEVELVGLVSELRNALEVNGLKGVNLCRHFERVEVLAVVGEPA